jgi:uncharacterized protein with PQ loop repeat
MRCEKCSEEYPPKYYFKDEGNTEKLICNNCYKSQELVTKAKRAAKQEDLDAEISYYKDALKCTGGKKQNLIKKKVSKCLSSRGIKNLNQAMEKITSVDNKSGDINKILLSENTISLLNSAKADLSEAINLDPKNSDNVRQLNQLESILSSLQSLPTTAKSSKVKDRSNKRLFVVKFLEVALIFFAIYLVYSVNTHDLRDHLKLFGNLDLHSRIWESGFWGKAAIVISFPVGIISAAFILFMTSWGVISGTNESEREVMWSFWKDVFNKKFNSKHPYSKTYELFIILFGISLFLSVVFGR